jgi:hypothetical protein
MKKIVDHMDEKVAAALKGFKGEFSIADFVAAFAKKNPEDWKRLEQRLIEEEKGALFRDWKKGAMPTPEKYLAGALKEYAKRNGTALKKVSNDRFAKKP